MRATIIRMWEGLDGEQRALLAQLVRYGVVGVGVTLFQISVYNLLAGPARWAPLVANTLATALAMVVGYTIHSRFTFEGHGERGDPMRTGGKFVAANLLGFAVNSWWVWSFTHLFHWRDWTPSLPMFFVTPALLFVVNRIWVFG